MFVIRYGDGYNLTTHTHFKLVNLSQVVEEHKLEANLWYTEVLLMINLMSQS